MAGLGASYLGAFAFVKNESPRGAALPVLIAIVVLAAAYWMATSEWAVTKWPFLGRFPGAWKEPGAKTRGIVYRRSSGTIRRPRVRGQDTGIEIDDDSDVDIDDPEIEDQ
jgi:hypothetical protein